MFKLLPFLLYGMRRITRLDLYAIYYLSNTNAKLVIDHAIADSRLRSRMFVEQS